MTNQSNFYILFENDTTFVSWHGSGHLWSPRCFSDVARSSTDVSKIIALVTNQVPMAPHATILCHSEAQHLHEAF